jgi:hypothetical protein
MSTSKLELDEELADVVAAERTQSILTVSLAGLTLSVVDNEPQVRGGIRRSFSRLMFRLQTIVAYC